MIKKLIYGVGAVVTLLLIAAAIYVVSIIEKRPSQAPEAVSVTYDGEYGAQAKQADAWLKAIYAENNLPSISAAVGIRGQLIWAGAIGYTDVKGRALTDTNTLYRIGSISKSLTAVAAMRMVEQGQIKLDESVSVYVPDFAQGKATYTIRQLLSHQSGIRHYSQSLSEGFNSVNYADTRAAAAFIENDPLIFEPGKGFQYSTYGYTVLALAMERTGRKPFEQIVREEVLNPANMAATRQDRTDATPEPAKPYLLVNGALVEAPEDNVSHKYAGGGYLSTPSDLVRFGNALLSDGFLTSESRKALWTPSLLADGKINPEYYALGFRVGDDTHGRFVHHGGTANGGYSFLLIYPETGMVVAMTANYTPMKAGFDRLAKAQKLAAVFRP